MQYIIAIGIFQAMIVIALLLKSRLQSSGDDLLILLLACIASHLAMKFFIFSSVDDEHVRRQMNTFIGFCYGPLLYLYALKASNSEFVPASRWYFFVPFILAAIAYFTVGGVLFLSKSSDYRLLSWYNKISTFALLASELCFAFLALRVARKHLAEKPKERKMVERIAACFLLITVLSIPFFVSPYANDLVPPLLVRSIVYAILTLLCIMIGYYRLFIGNHQDLTSFVAKDFSTEKILVVKDNALQRKSPLTAQKQQEIWESLENHLRDHKLFADSELNLDKLAQATGINKYHISETLNTYAKKSFYQYINEYRIEYAVAQMQILHRKEIPVNVLSLAYDAGFRAKSSFNRYFKDITGFTPTEHLKSLQ